MKNIGTWIGAGIGFTSFLAIGLMPALVYGGYAGLLLAGGIFGIPLDPTLLARALVVFGMGLGVVAIAGFFTLMGATAGSLVGYLAAHTVKATEKTDLAPKEIK